MKKLNIIALIMLLFACNEKNTKATISNKAVATKLFDNFVNSCNQNIFSGENKFLIDLEPVKDSVIRFDTLSFVTRFSSSRWQLMRDGNFSIIEIKYWSGIDPFLMRLIEADFYATIYYEKVKQIVRLGNIYCVVSVNKVTDVDYFLYRLEAFFLRQYISAGSIFCPDIFTDTLVSGKLGRVSSPVDFESSP